MQVTTIGLDIAKNVFQVHGIDGDEIALANKMARVAWALLATKLPSRCLLESRLMGAKRTLLCSN
jgi:hypothetical protein